MIREGSVPALARMFRRSLPAGLLSLAVVAVVTSGVLLVAETASDEAPTTDGGEESLLSEGESSTSTDSVTSPIVGLGDDNTLVYFFKEAATDTAPPQSYEAVRTQIENSGNLQERLHDTMYRLVRGANDRQLEAGLVSAFDLHPEAAVKGVVVSAGAVIVNFTGIEEVLQESSSSSGSAYLLAPIYLTAFQFPEVQTVELQLDGSCAALHGSLGGSCEIMTRATHEAWIAAWSE